MLVDSQNNRIKCGDFVLDGLNQGEQFKVVASNNSMVTLYDKLVCGRRRYVSRLYARENLTVVE